MTITSVPMLFDELDIPRVRYSDPISSHEAADDTQHHAAVVREAVRHLLWEAGFHGLTDDELNAAYARDYIVEGWPAVDYETPRRRRSDLKGEAVAAIHRRANSKGRPVTVWVLDKYAGELR